MLIKKLINKKNYTLSLTLVILFALFSCNRQVNNAKTSNNNIPILSVVANTPKNVLSGSNNNEFDFQINSISNNQANAKANTTTSNLNLTLIANANLTYKGQLYDSSKIIKLDNTGHYAFFYSPGTTTGIKTISFTFTDINSGATIITSVTFTIQTGFVINARTNIPNITTADTGITNIRVLSNFNGQQSIYTLKVNPGDTLYDYGSKRTYYPGFTDTLATTYSIDTTYNIGLINKTVNANRIVFFNIQSNLISGTRTDSVSFNVTASPPTPPITPNFNIFPTISKNNYNMGDTVNINLEIKSDGVIGRTYILYSSTTDTLFVNGMLVLPKSFIKLTQPTVTTDTTITVRYIANTAASSKTVQLQVKDLSNASVTASVSFSVSAPSVLIAVGNNGIARSINSGSNWTLIPNPSLNYLNSVAFSSSSNGIAVGNAGTIMQSTNGGLSWSSIQSPTTNNISAVAFSSPTNGIAIAGTNYYGYYYQYITILRTTNGGNSWTVNNINTRIYSSFNSIAFSSPTNGVIVGNGAILHTIDGGNTWTNISISYNLTSVAFSSPTNGIAVGNGIIFKTNDGGNTWSSIASSYNLYNVVFSSSTNGFIFINSSDTYLKTTDGGNNWLLYNTNYYNYNPFAVPYSSTNVFLFSNNSSAFGNTTDGGNTWNFNSNLGLVPNGVAVVPSN